VISSKDPARGSGRAQLSSFNFRSALICTLASSASRLRRTGRACWRRSSRRVSHESAARSAFSRGSRQCGGMPAIEGTADRRRTCPEPPQLTRPPAVHAALTIRGQKDLSGRRGGDHRPRQQAFNSGTWRAMMARPRRAPEARSPGAQAPQQTGAALVGRAQVGRMACLARWGGANQGGNNARIEAER
jgi:hypothetical protein